MTTVIVVRLFELLNDQCLGGEQQRRDRGRVRQCRAGHLDRVDDTVGDEVAELAGRGVEAVSDRQAGHLLGDDVALEAGVLRDPAQRLDQRLAHDRRASRFVAGEVKPVESRRGVHKGRAAAGNDAFFDGCPRRRDRVFEPVLLFLELDLGGRTDADDRDAAGQLGQALLQLVAIPLRVGALDLGAQLADPVGDSLGRPGTVDDGGVVLGDGDATRGAENVETDVFELQTQPRVRRIARR